MSEPRAYNIGGNPDLVRALAGGGYYHDRAGEFRQDLEEAFGTSDLPWGEKLYAMAWGRGHSNGFHEVFLEYEELLGLARCVEAANE